MSTLFSIFVPTPKKDAKMLWNLNYHSPSLSLSTNETSLWGKERLATGLVMELENAREFSVFKMNRT